MECIRATQFWQQAGAYSVRIQAMGRKHHIPLSEEFDEHDGPETKYILILDDISPVATARMYEFSPGVMLVGRVVVLPEYRGRGLGTRVIRACEEWARELGYDSCVLDSRENKTGFYRRLGYTETGDPPIPGETFRCIRMKKTLT